MSLEEKYQIVRSVGEECIQEDELRNLLEKKPEPVCYDGFEPSGRMHIAQVLLTFYLHVFLFYDQATVLQGDHFSAIATIFVVLIM